MPQTTAPRGISTNHWNVAITPCCPSALAAAHSPPKPNARDDNAGNRPRCRNHFWHTAMVVYVMPMPKPPITPYVSHSKGHLGRAARRKTAGTETTSITGVGDNLSWILPPTMLPGVERRAGQIRQRRSVPSPAHHPGLKHAPDICVPGKAEQLCRQHRIQRKKPF